MTRNVTILIFDDAEVLDFAGPFEVFSVTKLAEGSNPFNVFTVAKEANKVRAVNGLQVVPDYCFDNHPHIDILIVAGGQGTRHLLNDPKTLEWVERVHATTLLTLSICSGARVLGKLGLLDNSPFCTHHDVYAHMQEIAPLALPQPDKRFVQTAERLYTSGGISAGIDLSFYILEQLLGQECALATAHYMEYNYNPQTIIA